MTARTPLLIGGFPGKEGEPQDLPRRKDEAGTVMIPGSGMLGAVRSLHEALTGSCLRVVDLDWVPVHRHPPSTSETTDLRLAVVSDVHKKTGKPKSVKLCDDWMRVPRELLPGAASGDGEADDDALPRTGDQWRYNPAKRLEGNSLRVHDDEHPGWTAPGEIGFLRRMAPVTGDCWVLLLTDTNARPPRGRGNKPAAVRFWAGRVGPESPNVDVADPAWEDYLKTVAGADDLRTASLVKAGHPQGGEPAWGASPPEYADVWWPPRDEDNITRRAGEQVRQDRDRGRRPLGRRLRARSYLHIGQPVWVRVTGGEVTEIRLSYFWRYLGDTPVGERLGDAGPCTDPEKLCWSCRMFGSADTRGRTETGLAEQQSYRGHVRIDDLLAPEPERPVTWKLAPLASPKPSAGQFYLDNSAVPAGRRIAEKDTRPGATWGSLADQGDARPVRGRKVYWRTHTEVGQDEDSPARGWHRGHQSDTMSGEVRLIPAGTVFSGRVTFDNLDAAEYGSLLAALDPRLLATAGEDGWEDAVTSVGGGKPFGFGSVTVTVTQAETQTARQRYLGDSDLPATEQAAAVRAFRGRVRHADRAAWPALRNALAFGFIDDEKVWYPPGGGDRGSQDYDKSFEFFARTTGLRLSDGYRDLVVLPDASLPAASQELDSAAGEHRETGQRPPSGQRPRQGQDRGDGRGRGQSQQRGGPRPGGGHGR